jgi:hypothetical protein
MTVHRPVPLLPLLPFLPFLSTHHHPTSSPWSSIVNDRYDQSIISSAGFDVLMFDRYDQSIISSAGFDVLMFGSGEVAKILRAATSLKGDM